MKVKFVGPVYHAKFHFDGFSGVQAQTLKIHTICKLEILEYFRFNDICLAQFLRIFFRIFGVPDYY